MQIQAKPITNFLGKKYPGDILAEGIFEKKIHESAKAIPLDELPKQETVFVIHKKPRGEYKVINIAYKKPRDLFEKVKNCIGRAGISAKEVGEYTFDYFVNKEC
jgi:hypothetical protein